MGIASQSEVLGVSSWSQHPVVVGAQDEGVEVDGAPPQTQGLAGEAKAGVGAAQPERFLEDTRSVSEQAVDLAGVVEVVAAEHALALLALASPLDLHERVRGYPALAHGVVEARCEDVSILVAGLRRRWRDEHPQAFLAASHDPTVGFEFLRFARR